MGTPGSSVDIRMDLESDLRAFYAARLAEVSDFIDHGEGLEEIGRIYHEIAMRQISQRPRITHKATTLTCPSDLQAGLSEVIRKATNGESLLPHLSKFVVDPKLSEEKSKRDQLMYDYGVHHFHLNTVPDPKDVRFVDRTGPLLIVRVTNTDFYAIKIIEHGDWTDKEILDILYDEWPEAMKEAAVPGILGIDREFDEEETKILRKHGVMVLSTRADGTVHMPLGGGLATDGSSALVTARSDHYRRAARKLQEIVEADMQVILAKAGARGLIKDGILRLKMVIADNAVYAVAEGDNYAYACVGVDTRWLV